jgi:hypothetical protein
LAQVSLPALEQAWLPVSAELVAGAQPVQVALVVLVLAQASRQVPLFPLAWPRAAQAGLDVSPVSLLDARRASLLEPVPVAPRADPAADDSVVALA